MQKDMQFMLLLHFLHQGANQTAVDEEAALQARLAKQLGMNKKKKKKASGPDDGLDSLWEDLEGEIAPMTALALDMFSSNTALVLVHEILPADTKFFDSKQAWAGCVFRSCSQILLGL